MQPSIRNQKPEPDDFQQNTGALRLHLHGHVLGKFRQSDRHFLPNIPNLELQYQFPKVHFPGTLIHNLK